MNLLNTIIAHFKLLQIVRDRRGIAALEYALIAALIALAITAGISTFGSKVNTFFSGVGGSVGSLTTATTK